MNTKPIGKILIAAGMLLLVFAIGRSYYYMPSKEATEEIDLPQESLLAESAVLETSEAIAVSENSEPRSASTQSSASLPSRLSIPKIGVNAHVEHLGITRNGNMASPAGFKNVSWYKYGTPPGKVGSAVMAGHDNGLYEKGVFRDLNSLAVGDDVYVTDKNGKRLHYRVVEKRIYRYDQAPLERIFNRTDKARLNLITCTGEWMPSLRMSDHRVVIYTELVG